jgi:Cu2+-exporting ATPase
MTAATFSQSLHVDPAPFVRRDAKGLARLELAVRGMRCAGCMSKIENGIRQLPGVEEARVNLSSAKLNVRWREGSTSAERIVARVNELGFEAFPYDPSAILKQDDEEGRFLLTQGGETRGFGPGEACEVPAGVPHAEAVGPEGATYLVGRRGG